MPFGFISLAEHQRVLDAERAHAAHTLAGAQALYASLLDKYHALKLAGAVVREPAKPASPPPPSPEERILAEARAEYERGAMAELMAQGLTETQARETARLMRDAIETASPVSPLD